MSLSDRIKIILTILLVAAITTLAVLLVKAPDTPAPQPTEAQTEEATPVS